MAQWPARNSTPWDTALKSYIDENLLALAEAIDGAGGGSSAIVPTSAVNIHDAAHTGFKITDMVASGGTLSEVDYANIMLMHGTTDANLVTLMPFANDYLNNGASPALGTTALSRQIDDFRALPNTPSILLIIPHNLVGHESSGRNWNDYRAAIISVATQKGTGLFDMATVIPPAGSGGPLLASDGLHYSDAGHTAISVAIADFFAGLLTSKPAWAKAWLAALCTSEATWVAWGDSLTEGQGASTKANRWLDKTLALLRSRYGLPASTRTYVPGFYAVYGPDSNWGTTYTKVESGGGGAANSITNQNFAPGLGLRTIQVGKNCSYTQTIKGGAVEIDYIQSARMTVSIDGGPETPLPGVLDTTIRRLVLPLGLPTVNHTVKITNPNSADYNEFDYVLGAYALQDAVGGSAAAASSGGASGTASMARIYRSGTNQPVPSGAVTFIALNAVDFNRGDAFDTSVAGQITILKGGAFLVGCGAQFTSGAAGLRNLQIRVNNTYARSTGAATANANDFNVGPIMDEIILAAGDVVKMSTYVDGGTNVDVRTGADSTALFLTRIGD